MAWAYALWTTIGGKNFLPFFMCRIEMRTSLFGTSRTPHTEIDIFRKTLRFVGVLLQVLNVILALKEEVLIWI